MRIHDQHVGIARQAIEAARIKYTVGKVPQQDMLKAQVALTRLAEHMIRFDRDAEIARARLNTLLGRDPDAPLTVHGDYAALTALPAASSARTIWRSVPGPIWWRRRKPRSEAAKSRHWRRRLTCPTSPFQPDTC